MTIAAIIQWRIHSNGRTHPNVIVDYYSFLKLKYKKLDSESLGTFLFERMKEKKQKKIEFSLHA